MKILKFLVIEDDARLREALCGASREALRELEREAIIFEASDRSEATRIVEQHAHIDLILLDLELPDTDGFEFLRELGISSPFDALDLTLSWYPTVSLVVVSERQDYDCVLSSALDVGAVGFIPKLASRETILDAFRISLETAPEDRPASRRAECDRHDWPTKACKRWCERRDASLRQGMVFDRDEHADAAHAVALLRPSRERPRRCHESRKEIPPTHGSYLRRYRSSLSRSEMHGNRSST